jgi:RND family efflux transporter MFP subunit
MDDPNIKTRIAVCIVILGLGIAILSGLLMITSKPEEKPMDQQLIRLVTEPVSVDNISLKISDYGTVRPSRQVKIASELKGNIIYVKPGLEEGSLVEKGEVLVKIEDSDYKIALKEAEAEEAQLKAEKSITERTVKDIQRELKELERDYELEQKNYNRQKVLFDKKVSTQSDLENAEQALAQKRKSCIIAEASLAQAELQIQSISAKIEKAEASRQQAELNIKRSNIKAPFSGRIEAIPVEENEYINAGEDLFEIADDGSLEIPISLDAFDIAKLLPLKPDKDKDYRHWFKNPEKVPVIIEWTGMPDACRWTGKIIRIEKFNSETRTLTLIVVPEKCISKAKEPFPLVSGMFCKVTFTGKGLPGLVRIPWVALQLDNNIFVVDENGIINERDVEIYSCYGDQVIVSSGLKDGDKIVAQKVPRGIINGMKIKPVAPRKKDDKKTSPVVQNKKIAEKSSKEK